MVDTVTLAAADPATSLSMWGLFMQAGLVVKAVMLMLIAASIWCWAIIVDKVMRIRRLNSQADHFEESFWSGGALDELYDRIGSRPVDPMSALFLAAMREWRRSASRGGLKSDARASLPQRIDRVMHVTLNRETDKLYRRVGFLASTGSVAPFIGLFGTVWGIMSSFHAIGMTKNTSLAVVAPGIAEALFATALGLLAAIPAVVAYNKISTDLNRYVQRMEAFAGEFGAILSRQLEERA
ncbi:MAG: protein TolQ [Alphaproteobacteria bacterium RIFOXYD12_FULL_60_8]|nr:MAG: protein TolQ [Alphaproteobacteria bacterium RIFOXYD12_FULL_60_8]